MIINKSFKITKYDNFNSNSNYKNINGSKKLHTVNNQFNPLEIKNSRGMGLNEISFKAFNESDFIKQRATKNKHLILNSISEILEEDKRVISSAFWGEVTDETKFSKASWYIKLKNESKDENILENINLRKFIKLYNEFYKNNLSSAYEVAHKEKTYINEEKNNKIISHFEKNGNLDEYLEKVIDNYFIDYKNQNNIPKENINNVLITQEKNKLYKILNTNPLLIKPEELEKFLKITNDVLEISNNKTYNAIVSSLMELSSALKNNKKESMINSFKELKNNVLPIWENQILTKKLSKKENNIKLIKDFKKSNYYEMINYDKKMGQIFELPFFSIEEKAFLVEQINKDMEISSPTSRTFLEFIKNTVIEDDKKKTIVQRVMNDMKIADENFILVKDKFIEDIRNKDEDSILLQKKLGNCTILELILDKIEIDERHPLIILNDLTDEDLNQLLDEIKPLWLNEKYKESCKREEAKYDIADNFESILNKLTIEENGKQIGINEFVEKAFSTVYGNLDILKQDSDKVIKEIMNNRSILITHDLRSKFEYTALMQQLSKITDILQEQSATSERLHTEISKILDKLEIIAPNKKKEIQYARSTLERLKDGIFNKQNLIPMVFGTQAAISLGTTATAVAAGAASAGTLVLPIVLLAFYGLTVIGNIRREYKKEC